MVQPRHAIILYLVQTVHVYMCLRYQYARMFPAPPTHTHSPTLPVRSTHTLAHTGTHPETHRYRQRQAAAVEARKRERERERGEWPWYGPRESWRLGWRRPAVAHPVWHYLPPSPLHIILVLLELNSHHLIQGPHDSAAVAGQAHGPDKDEAGVQPGVS